MLTNELNPSADSDKLPARDMGFTKAEIIRLKTQFLDRLKKNPFIGNSASAMNLPERLIHAWMRTDSEFAASVYESQRLVVESVAGNLLTAALGGDTSVMMFLAKQYGATFNEILLRAAAVAGEPPLDTDTPAIENLTTEEQIALLGLLRKAKNPNDVKALTEYVPTKFIETEDEESATGA